MEQSSDISHKILETSQHQVLHKSNRQKCFASLVKSVAILRFHEIMMIIIIITRISFYCAYASAVMMGLVFPGVKQCDAIKHI